MLSLNSLKTLVITIVWNSEQYWNSKEIQPYPENKSHKIVVNDARGITEMKDLRSGNRKLS